MTRPRLLDLFCGAGGAAMGYHRAGFDVVGVDIRPQPNYPFEFVQADALEVPLDGYDAIHASPPCQAHSFVTRFHRGKHAQHPDLIPPTRAALERSDVPYVIENVPGAPVRADLTLCGEMFGLKVHRHRLFECGGWIPFRLQHQPHELRGARTNCDTAEDAARLVAGHYSDHAGASRAMGIEWMNRHELREAIPPAYTEFIGTQFLQHVRARQAA